MEKRDNHGELEQGHLSLLSFYKEQIVKYEREIEDLNRRLLDSDQQHIDDKHLEKEKELCRKLLEAKKQIESLKKGGISYKWGWKTWLMFCLFLLFLSIHIYIVYRVLNSPVLQLELFDKIIFINS